MAKKHYRRQRNRIFKHQLNVLVESLPVTILAAGKYVTLAKYIGFRYSRNYLHGCYVFESLEGDPYCIEIGRFYFDEPHYLHRNISWNHVITVASNPRPLVIWLWVAPASRFFRKHPLCEPRLLSVIQSYIH